MGSLRQSIESAIEGLFQRLLKTFIRNVPDICNSLRYTLNEVERSMSISCSGFPTADIVRMIVYIREVLSKMPDMITVLANVIDGDVQMQFITGRLLSLMREFLKQFRLQ